MRATLFSLFLTIVIAAGAGLVGVLTGRELADGPGEYRRGVDEGERLGRVQGRAAFAPGDERYDAVVRRARTAGYEEGRRKGVQAGAERGRRRGRAAVFAGFDGGWDVGKWYLVDIAPGSNSSDVRIGGRVALRAGRWYGLCERPTGLCQRVSRRTQ
jgi:hypothetical protein